MKKISEGNKGIQALAKKNPSLVEDKFGYDVPGYMNGGMPVFYQNGGLAGYMDGGSVGGGTGGGMDFGKIASALGGLSGGDEENKAMLDKITVLKLI